MKCKNLLSQRKMEYLFKLNKYTKMFSTVITTYKDVKKYFDCVEDLAEKHDKSVHEILVILDRKYRGIKLSYEIYVNEKKFRIIYKDSIIDYNKKGSSIYVNEKSYEEAQWNVKNMYVNITGARKGDILLGVRKNISETARIRITSGLIPPSKRDLNNVRLYPLLWGRLINKLSNLPFYSEMTTDEIEDYLYENEKEGDFDIAEVGAKAEVLDVGNSTFKTIEDEGINELLSEGDKLIKDIRDYFPKKPGRHTLIFFLHFWRIETQHTKVKSFDGIVYDLKDGLMKSSAIDEEIYLFTIGDEEKKKEFGIIVDNSKSRVDYIDLLLNKFDFSKEHISSVKEATRGFTAAGYKSLLQKIIRYAPEHIDNLDLPIDFVLCCVFTILLTHPGSFVPDIQRFVSGQESAFKRLSISILEDSSISDDSAILKLGFLAFLSQRMIGFKPSESDYLWTLDICIESLKSKKVYIQDIKKGFELKPFKLLVSDETSARRARVSVTNSNLKNFSCLLDNIKSFASDLAMTRFIAYNEGKSTKEKYTIFKSMNIYHSVDQHWAPEITYLLPLKIIDEYKLEGSKPFSDLFRNIFINLSGINARRPTTGLSGHIPDKRAYFIDSVEFAQKIVLFSKQNDPKILEETKKSYNIKTTLSIEWIAGLVGPIDVKGKPAAMVSMRPSDPYQLVAVKKPSRGMKDGKLDDEREEKAIAEAKRILSDKGVPLNKAVAPLPSINKYTLILKDDEYVFINKKEELSWDDLSAIDINIPFTSSVDVSLENTIKYKNEGIMENAFEKFETILSLYKEDVLRRTYFYISSFRTSIEVSRLSKDGGGTSSSVVATDVGACQLLLYISLLFGAALQRETISKFKVVCAPLLWQVRDILKNKFSNKKEIKSKWVKMEDSSERELRSYQKEALDEMIEKNKQGYRGHFLWMVVGLGKTMVAMYYLKYLRDIGKLPKYVIYSLPKSALISIITEIEFFGIPINLLVPIKSWKKHKQASYIIKNEKLVEYHINLIEHDHLRLVENELIEKAPEAIFIIDEVHKTLNDTKRTSTALEVSKLAIDVICLTGTPIVDSNMYKLIWWLEQIVNFDVNDKNFWVAINGMISKTVNTGILVKDIEVEAEMTTSENKKYLSLIPTSIGGKNKVSSSKDIREAFDLCYNVCDRQIIDSSIELLEHGGVMVVGRNNAHCETLKEMFKNKGIKSKDIFIIQKDEKVHMTDESVESGKVHDYKIVITPLSKSEGYTLSRLKSMVTGVYPSNQATRTQLRGRINRLSQKAKEVTYVIVHTGILTYVLEKHNDANSIMKVMEALATSL
jgi:superfamily II DNA or RNA helicase